MESTEDQAALPAVVTRRDQLLEEEEPTFRRRAPVPLCCKVSGCTSDLTSAPKTHQRFRLCNAHIKAPVVIVDGVPSRFCQQCSRFQPLDDFNGTNRTCRMMLIKNRERQRGAAAASTSGLGPAMRRAQSPTSAPRSRQRSQQQRQASSVGTRQDSQGSGSHLLGLPMGEVEGTDMGQALHASVSFGALDTAAMGQPAPLLAATNGPVPSAVQPATGVLALPAEAGFDARTALHPAGFTLEAAATGGPAERHNAAVAAAVASATATRTSPFARCSAPAASLAHCGRQQPHFPYSPVASPPLPEPPLSPAAAELNGLPCDASRVPLLAQPPPPPLPSVSLQPQLHNSHTRSPRARLLRQVSAAVRRAQSCGTDGPHLGCADSAGGADPNAVATGSGDTGGGGAGGVAYGCSGDEDSGDGAGLFHRMSAPPLGSNPPQQSPRPAAGGLHGARSVGDVTALLFERTSSSSFKRRRSGGGFEEPEAAGVSAEPRVETAIGVRHCGGLRSGGASTAALQLAEDAPLLPQLSSPVFGRRSGPVVAAPPPPPSPHMAAEDDRSVVATAVAALVQQQERLLEQQRLQVQQLQSLQEQNELQLRRLLQLQPKAAPATEGGRRRRQKNAPADGSDYVSSSGSACGSACFAAEGGAGGSDSPSYANGNVREQQSAGFFRSGRPTVDADALVVAATDGGGCSVAPSPQAPSLPLGTIAGPGGVVSQAGAVAGGGGASPDEDELLAAIAAAAASAPAGGGNQPLAALAARWRCEDDPDGSDGADGRDLMEVDAPPAATAAAVEAAPPAAAAALGPAPPHVPRGLYDSLPGMLACPSGLAVPGATAIAHAPAAGGGGGCVWARSAQSEPAWGYSAVSWQPQGVRKPQAQLPPPTQDPQPRLGPVRVAVPQLQPSTAPIPSTVAAAAPPIFARHTIAAPRTFSPLRPRDPTCFPAVQRYLPHSGLVQGAPMLPQTQSAAAAGAEHVPAATGGVGQHGLPAGGLGRSCSQGPEMQAAYRQQAPPQVSSAVTAGDMTRGAGCNATHAVADSAGGDLGDGAGGRKAVGEETEELLQQLMCDLFGGATGGGAGAGGGAAADSTAGTGPCVGPNTQHPWPVPLSSAPPQGGGSACERAPQRGSVDCAACVPQQQQQPPREPLAAAAPPALPLPLSLPLPAHLARSPGTVGVTASRLHASSEPAWQHLGPGHMSHGQTHLAHSLSRSHAAVGPCPDDRLGLTGPLHDTHIGRYPGGPEPGPGHGKGNDKQYLDRRGWHEASGADGSGLGLSLGPGQIQGQGQEGSGAPGPDRRGLALNAAAALRAQQLALQDELRWVDEQQRRLRAQMEETRRCAEALAAHEDLSDMQHVSGQHERTADVDAAFARCDRPDQGQECAGMAGVTPPLMAFSGGATAHAWPGRTGTLQPAAGLNVSLMNPWVNSFTRCSAPPF